MQLIKLLIGATLIAATWFCGMNYMGNYVIDTLYSEEYIEKQNRYYITELEKYIKEKQLKIKDVQELDAWVKEKKVLSLRMYKNHKQIFDSEYPNEEVWDEEIEEGEFGRYYFVQFKDGIVKVRITGAYVYKIYNYALMIELLIAMVIFLLIVLLGIRKKMNYILVLSNEIEILEGGSLDYPITIEGKDELAALAQGLDHMRFSFQKIIEEEAKMIQENQKIVTQMSHDLRTPITSIMLYTEILKKGAYKSQEELLAYLEKIEQKSRRMKQLTDNLFEYSLVTGEGEITLEEAESFEVLFFDLLSETCGYLEQKGFSVMSQIEWNDCLLRVYSAYLMRIMDNITSNILKYAARDKVIKIVSLEEEKMIGFAFENMKKPYVVNQESTCVGIQSIKSMMAKMNGICEVDETKTRFTIHILFPKQFDEEEA